MLPVLRIDDTAIRHGLAGFAREIPFAISLAMNLSAQDCLPLLRRDLFRSFTIRNNWEAAGLTFVPANKRHLAVLIGSRHDYMEAQVLGGEKTGKGGSVAVPMIGQGLPRTKLTSRTPPKKWPKAIIGADQGTFAAEVRGKMGVWRRVWRNKDTGKILSRAAAGTLRQARAIGTRERQAFYGKGNAQARPGLALLWAIEDRVKIPSRWPLRQQVEERWNAAWPGRAVDAIKKTLRHSVDRGAKRGKWWRD